MRNVHRLSAPFALLFAAKTLVAQTEPAATASDLYLGAAALIATESPSASSGEFPGYPPMGAEWQTLAEAAWQQNGEAREKAREANAAPTTGWPPGKDWTYLNKVRALANELGDAAQYRGLAGDLPAAVGFVNDLLDIGDKLRVPPLGEKVFIYGLVAGGIDALAASRVMILAPEVAAAKDAPVADVRKLIGRLLIAPDVADALAQAPKRDEGQAGADRARVTFARIDAERRMAAMSLACQLYRRDKAAWPAKADDLVPAYLPAIPIDPADGKTPLGYLLIAKGLPDGGDRPLVYSREESADGMAYRTDSPQYGFYDDNASSDPRRPRLKTGQFRDVARWVPTRWPVRTEQPALRPMDEPFDVP